MKKIVAMILALAVLLTVVAVFAEGRIGVQIRRVRPAEYYGDKTMLKAFRTDGEVDSNTVWEICKDYVNGMRVWKRLGTGPCLSVTVDYEAVRCGYRCRLSNGTSSDVYVFTDITERPAEQEPMEETTDGTAEDGNQEIDAETPNGEMTEPSEEDPAADQSAEQETEETIPAESGEQIAEETVPEDIEEQDTEENLSADGEQPEMQVDEVSEEETSPDETEEHTDGSIEDVNDETNEQKQADEDSRTEPVEVSEAGAEEPETENAEGNSEVTFEFESIEEIEKLFRESVETETEIDAENLQPMENREEEISAPDEETDSVTESADETVVEPTGTETADTSGNEEAAIEEEPDVTGEETDTEENAQAELSEDEIEFIETPEDLNAMMIVPEGTSMLIRPMDGSDEVILLEENTVVRVVALSTEWAKIELLAGDEVTYTGYVRKETIKLLPTKEPLPTPVTWVEAETAEKGNDGVVYEGEAMYLCVDASVYENLVRIRWQCDYGIRGNWQDIPGAEGNRYPIVVTSKNVNYLFRVMLTIDE